MKKKLLKALDLTSRNAFSLFDEAQLLVEHQKVGRGYALYHLSFEESGRYMIVFNYLREFFMGRIEARDLNYGDLKKLGFEKHDVKISEGMAGILNTVLINEFQKSKQESPEEFYKEIGDEFIFAIEKKIGKMPEEELKFNRIKNTGLYVHFHNNDFYLPDEVITLGQYDKIKRLANLGLRVIEFHEKLRKKRQWS